LNRLDENSRDYRVGATQRGIPTTVSGTNRKTQKYSSGEVEI